MKTPPPKVLLPGGIDNFRELITHRDSEGNACLFVDKTLFIKDFIDAGDKITLITRPRRFGKTLTLSMLQHFLAAEVDGQPTQGLFDGLNISHHPEIMRHQGQHPVIFLTLKGGKGEHYQDVYDIIKTNIRHVYEEHSYLLSSAKLHAHQKRDFQKILAQEAQVSDYKYSLHALSQYLYQHTGQKVYLLLDEYDTPMNDAYVHGYYDACSAFFAGMFGETFKGNSALERGLITGILKIAKASLFSALNNLKVYTMLSDVRYARYFGFTEAETDDFLDRAGLPQKAHAIKEMYNGYELEGYTLYNPFSIVAFTSEWMMRGAAQMEKALQPYWINTGGTHLITDLIRHNVRTLTQGLQSLIQGKPIDTLIDDEVVFDPYLRDNPVGFWSVLLLAGYLKVVDRRPDGPFDRYTIAFPNEEIRRTMERVLLSVVAGRSDRIFPYVEGIRSLIQGDMEAFTDFLKRYLAHTPSYFDTGGRNKEAFYQGLVLGMASLLSYTHEVTSNRESGGGRYDICLSPKHPQDRGVLLELKVAEAGADLSEVARTAQAQIETKSYATAMQQAGVKELLYVGIAFRNKEVEVVSKVA